MISDNTWATLQNRKEQKTQKKQTKDKQNPIEKNKKTKTLKHETFQEVSPKWIVFSGREVP